MYEEQITPEMKEQAMRFAREKVESRTAYPRTESQYLPVSNVDISDLAVDKETEQWLRKLDRTTKNQVAHWYVGKVAEQIGQEILETLNIPHECPDKWRIVADPYFKDTADVVIFPKTSKEKKVNFRAGWRPFHARLIVPPDMYRNQPSDFYIGIKLDLPGNKAYIYGYATRNEFHWDDSLPLPAYALPYNQLHELDELKNMRE